MSGYSCISVQEVGRLLEHPGLMILDTRDLPSYRASHHPDALHLTDANIGPLLKQIEKDRPLLFYCYRGNSSRDMAKLFSDFGFSACYSLDGGYTAWQPELAKAGVIAA